MPLPASTSRLPRSPRLVLSLALCGGLLAMGAMPLWAQGLGQSERDDIIAQLRQLREQQMQITQMQQQTEQSIRALESRLDVTSPASPVVMSGAVAIASAPATSPPASSISDRLKISGDVRVRAQGDYSDNLAENRVSNQIRARLGATYAVNERVTLGARMSTGDSNDPNSTDAQLSNWNNDLEISLDMAWAQLNLGDLKLYAGKFPQPFTRTDLVWDGDVNPQGVAATFKTPLANGGAFRANGLFYTIANRTLASESYMSGAQFGYDSPAAGPLKFDFSTGYYHYHLGNMAGADAGDWRTNRLDGFGNYVSGYRLLDVVGSLTWQRSERWPLKITGDYVRNLGADDEDTGFGVDIALGRASQVGDWRLTYGYSQTEVDAVLSAFSHDNIGIATNYKLHAMTVDYTWMPKTMLSAIWYHYKPNNPLYAGSRQPDDWLDRFRVFLLVNF